MAARVFGRLPPLNALKTFVAAARLCSFAKAADELSVTPAAVSRSVKALEESLGCALFHRSHRSVELTPEGKFYLSQLGDAFDQIARATRDLDSRRAGLDPEKIRRPIVVCAYPSLAINWLVPRWYRFAQTGPGFDMRVVTTQTHSVDFSGAGVDLAILSDRTDHPGCRHEHLFAARLAPVCSPSYPAPAIDPSAPVAWGEHLLHSETRPNDWRRWSIAAGCGWLPSGSGRRFENSKLMYEAAVAGAGVAVAILEIVHRELTGGQLITPYSLDLSAECPFFLVYPSGPGRHPAFDAFRSWILTQAVSET